MSNNKLIPIVYVGKKPHAFDNVARSGKQWKGKGTVQEVTPAQAKILLNYPDQWGLVNKADQARIDDWIETVSVMDGDGSTVTVPKDGLKSTPLENMDKTQLKAYSKANFNKDLDGRLSTKAMIDQIEEWQKDGV